MRVISGSAKGHKLLAPEGLLTRPTGDRIKEDMFNLYPDVTGKSVLDLFAGSGALGIEALSRGAASAVFVDSDRNALSIVKKNLEKTRLISNAETVLSSARQYLSITRKHFDVLYMDPPYNSGDCGEIIGFLVESDFAALNPRALIVLEAGAEEAAKIILPPGLVLYKKKDYKITTLLLLLYERNNE